MKHLLMIILLITGLSAFSQGKHCQGITKKGQPCKSIMVDSSGYCRLHNPHAKHCAGTNAKGKPCGMIVKDGETYCRFHGGN